jgi:Fe-S-cluster-containing hydrogenase component 2
LRIAPGFALIAAWNFRGIEIDSAPLSYREAELQKSLLIDPGKCTSCLQCEMACSAEHTGAFNPARSRIKIFEFEHGARSIPYTCTQCAEAWCLHACPVEAITKNMETGADACPTGAITYVDSGWTGYDRMQEWAVRTHAQTQA